MQNQFDKELREEFERIQKQMRIMNTQLKKILEYNGRQRTAKKL